MKNELAMFKIIMLMMTKNQGGHASGQMLLYQASLVATKGPSGGHVSGQMLFYQASLMDTLVAYDGVCVYPLSRLEFWLAPPT